MSMMAIPQEPINTESRAGRGILHIQGSPPRPGRLQFIDAFRGWAVLIMVETHVINSMLRPELMDGAFFKVLNFINGLVAPSFLFAAGLTFAIATRRKGSDYLSFRPALFKQLFRLGLLFVIGYGLHIPKFEYHHLRYDAGIQAWHDFFKVDILQCISASLLLLLLLLFLLRTERRMYGAAAVLFIGVIITTPLIWAIDFWNTLPIPLAEYLNGLHASLFPLFPWAAFVIGGALFGYNYLKAAQPAEGTSDLGRKMSRFALFAAGIILLSFVLHPFAALIYPSYDYWKTSPSFLLLRLGLVMLLCIAGFFWEKRRGISSSSVITISGRESLLLYT
ncbi:MAG: heparan-alpha-glucosaminide N-acetyltransferase domain-containing protein, partial [Bacteroidota bacterium]